MSKAKTAAQPALFQEPKDARKPAATIEAKANPPEKRPAAPKRKNEVVIHQPQAHPPADVLSIIASAAANPKVDVAKMEALLRMQKDIMAEQAKVEFTTAFIAMQDELPVINATGRIVIEAKAGKRGQKTPFATFQEIHRVTMPILRRHGFALNFATEPSENGERLLIKTYLKHRGGHVESTSFPLPAESTGSKNNAQAWGSAFSYGKRYGAIALLNIVSEAKEDRDLDGATPKGDAADDAVALINEKQLKELTAAIEDCGVGPAMFCNKYEIDKVSDLPAAQFAEAIKACADYKAKKTTK